MTKSATSKGFTLTELITVIMIVLILCAILFPVIFRAKDKSKEVVCISNLRQEYLAVKLYESDFEGLPNLSSRNSWWTDTYFGGTRLACPKAYAGFDYSIDAGPLTGKVTPALDHLNELHEECSEKRGPDFPYVEDSNHMSDTENYQGLGARVLLVRASGSAQSLPYHGGPIPPKYGGTVDEYNKWPCPELGWSLDPVSNY